MLAEETAERFPEEHSRSFFVTKLAPLADIFINDAFSVAHRSHASVVGFPKMLAAGVGRLMEKELGALKRAVQHVEKPCVYVLGGVKPEEVFDIADFALESEIADDILTTGFIGSIFLCASGVIEMSEAQKADKDFLECVGRAQKILGKARDIVKYPEDMAIEVEGKRKEIQVGHAKPGQLTGDIGKKTSEKYSRIIRDARTVIMKGPAGICEKRAFMNGTREILRAISISDAFSLIGGGHTAATMRAVGVDKSKMSNTYVSLSGGAFLRYLSGKSLPGIEVLKRRRKEEK